MSCGAWLDDRRTDRDAALAAQDWVLGYLTAYNEYVAPDGAISRGTDQDGMMAWLDGYCQSHPLDLVGQAATALVRELRARKPTAQ
jgi:hypothetical protein